MITTSIKTQAVVVSTVAEARALAADYATWANSDNGNLPLTGQGSVMLDIILALFPVLVLLGIGLWAWWPWIVDYERRSR